MKTQKLNVTWTGFRPLIMTNPQTVKLSNVFAVKSRDLSKRTKAARKKEDEDRLVELEQEQIRNDWEASAFWDYEAKKFFVPDELIQACIRGGAMVERRGKDIERGLILDNEGLVYVENVRTHKSLDEYAKDDGFRLEGPCRIPPKTGALIWKARCMMPSGWKITFCIEYDPDTIALPTLKTAMGVAGSRVGMGGWRPRFGRFTVETKEEE